MKVHFPFTAFGFEEALSLASPLRSATQTWFQTIPLKWKSNANCGKEATNT